MLTKQYFETSFEIIAGIANIIRLGLTEQYEIMKQLKSANSETKENGMIFLFTVRWPWFMQRYEP